GRVHAPYHAKRHRDGYGPCNRPFIQGYHHGFGDAFDSQKTIPRAHGGRRTTPRDDLGGGRSSGTISWGRELTKNGESGVKSGTGSWFAGRGTRAAGGLLETKTDWASLQAVQGRALASALAALMIGGAAASLLPPRAEAQQRVVELTR